MRAIHCVSAAAAVMLSVQPCLAAEDLSATGSTERRMGAFAGVSLRLPMGAGHSERPSARLQLTTTQSYRHNGMQLHSSFAPGLELGTGRLGRPAFFMGGQELTRSEQRLQIGKTTTIVVIGAVVLGVVVLAAVVSAMPTAGPPEDAFD